jgi:Zn-dependent protease with chaperone function
MLIDALLYDGKSSKEHEVVIDFTKEKRVIIDSHGIDVSINEVEIESRLGNTPRVIEFVNGIRCKSRENDKIDQILKEFGLSKSKAYKIESSLGLTLGSVLVTIGFIWFMLTTGSTYTANILASILPASTLTEVSEVTMNQLEDGYLRPSKLSDRQERIIQEHFDKLVDGERGYKLHFRSSPKMGPNAFALPSGDIVLTDQLVALSQDDEFRDILGVLAHEKGHVVKKHSLRIAIKTGISGAIIGYITGDVSVLASTIPTILINSSYSREFEHEADVHAVKELKDMNISTKYIATLFEELEKKQGGEENATVMSMFASHPLTSQRIDYFKSYID